MNIASLKQALTSNVGRSVLQVRKTSPQILTAVGVVGFVATTVMAAKATLKLEKTVEVMEENILEAKTSTEDSDTQKRQLTVAYVKGAGSIVKLYTPTIAVGLASVGCLLGAQGIMQKRNVALAAAYKAIEESYSNYRARVVEELGEEKEREFRISNFHEETVKDEETGEEKTLCVVDEPYSRYARFFDQLCPAWERNSEYNMTYLICQQEMANQLLKSRGHLFLNEVYDSLGIPRSKEGAVVGWLFDREHPDTYVDFGIHNGDREMVRQFVNGYEPAILLDFNVQGTIWDKI